VIDPAWAVIAVLTLIGAWILMWLNDRFPPA